MSTATLVPETSDLDGADIGKTLAQVSTKELLVRAFQRLRFADGFSLARSLAFQVALAIFPGIIFVVALAVRLGEGTLQGVLRELISTLAPGPAGQTLLRAFEQGSDTATTGNTAAIALGGLAFLVSAVTAMAQLQRGASRIYGVEADRPTVRRYGLATVLTLTVGVLLLAAFLLTALGANIGGYFRDELAEVWRWTRWPLGVGLLTLAFAAIFKVAPNRRQPGLVWLAAGSLLSGAGWLLVSVGLSLYLNASVTFGQTYGPVAGFMGLLLWAELSAIAIFYGLAAAAQLEAERGGRSDPRSDTKLANGSAQEKR